MSDATPHQVSAAAAERLYHVVAINERTGFKSYLTVTPVTHHEGCTILSKVRPHPHVRKQLEDALVKEETSLATEARARAIIEGIIHFDPTAVERKFGSPHVFPFVGTIDMDAIYRDPHFFKEANE